MSAVVHEVSHGLAALWQGDPTAKYADRLTLNPLKHLDPFGSVLLPLLLVFTRSPFFIAWAKPVPYNPYNLRNQKYGPAIVGAAGPLSNIFIALIFGFFLKVLLITGNISADFSSLAFAVFYYVILINLMLAFFNLIPFPPLDGSKLLFAFFPIREETKMYLEQYGFFFLIPFIVLFSGVIGTIIHSIQNAFFKVVVGI
ncbi:MAG: M50 family peptidase [Candidatus Moranbacteria bacterium GW2011_GWC1_45_18]|nr:MAG: Peptidase M50 [Candidatus Moranbacteria bacterium GW2011_GWC2_40_12]KKT99759.1 MAG: M50 family peptidase [Candidatus Moranbacteria bacterium GW2011_GWC1_45_18]